MISPRTAKAIEAFSPEGPTAETALRIVGAADFQLIHKSKCTPSLLQEVSDFLDRYDTSHPFQLPQWSGREALFACLRSHGELQWFAQGNIFYPAGRFLPSIRALTVNRGPVCADLGIMETGLRELAKASSTMKIGYIDIAPEWTGAFADSAATVLARNGWQTLPGARSSLRLDLRPSLEDLMASFRKTTRYEIRRSESAGIKVTAGQGESDCRDFVSLYREMASQKQFGAEDSDFVVSIVRWLAADPGRGALLIARADGSLRGGALIVRSGVRCWYVYAATSKDGKISAGHLLQWRAIEWAKEQGCVEYDFGGFREGVSTGPALFKKGFCDRVVHFLPPHRYVTNAHRYRAYELVSNLRRIIRRPLSA